MPNFPSIKSEDRLPVAFSRFNTGIEKPLMQLHQVLMKSEESPFSEGERELIAAYVSGLMNDCGYCVGIHKRIAVKHGVKEGLLESLLTDIDSSGIDKKMIPVFKFVKKLTQEPTRVLKADAEAVYIAGWNERALYDALVICCTWNFMNRFVEGLGLEVSEDQHKDAAEMLMGGYEKVISKFGLK